MMCLNKKCGKISCILVGYENYHELDIDCWYFKLVLIF